MRLQYQAPRRRLRREAEELEVTTSRRPCGDHDLLRCAQHALHAPITQTVRRPNSTARRRIEIAARLATPMCRVHRHENCVALAFSETDALGCPSTSATPSHRGERDRSAELVRYDHCIIRTRSFHIAERNRAIHHSAKGSTIPERSSGRDGEEQEGEDLLRNAEQGQPVRDPLQDSGREESGDPRPADRAIHRMLERHEKIHP